MRDGQNGQPSVTSLTPSEHRVTLIALDIDGVLNGFGNARGEQLAVTEVGRWKIRWRPPVVARLRAILARSDVQGAWLTTWLEQPWLLDEFEAALGLDGLMPHRADHPSVDTRAGATIIDERFDQSIAFDSNSEWWWKRRAAELLLDRVQPARFAWIDDEIGNVRINADPWGPQQNHQRLLLRTRSFPGLLPRDLDRLESWLTRKAA